MKKNRRGYWLIMAIVLSFIMTYLKKYHGYSLSLAFVYNLFFLSFFTFLNIYVHEFGHLISGSLVGIKFYSIQIGNGNIIWHRKIFNINFDHTDNLRGGHVIPSYIPNTDRKLKLWIMTSGGILAQSLLTGLVIVILGFSFSDFLGNKGISISSSFIISNLLMIILNIIPMSTIFYGVKLPNDGAKLFKIPFWKKEDIDKLLQVNMFFKAHKYFELHEYKKAEECYKELIQESKMPVINFKVNLSLVYIKQLMYQKAIDILLKVGITNNNYFEAIRRNNLAWTYLLIGGDESIAKALEHSEVGMKLNGEMNNMKSTRACVLIESGRIEQGLLLLKQTVKINGQVNRKTNNPINLVYIAYAYNLLGKENQSNAILEKVNKSSNLFDPDEKILYDRILAKMENDA